MTWTIGSCYLTERSGSSTNRRRSPMTLPGSQFASLGRSRTSPTVDGSRSVSGCSSRSGNSWLRRRTLKLR